ncbi:MAG: hypothetical protein V2J24_14470 [Pseudomonadales bacterium]|jgi:hypothetical protein|nr:hypothetical protein [Pseudomonadales bacterium]
MSSRRELLRGAALLPLLAAGGPRRVRATTTRPGDRIAAAIEHWDSLGVHRTGTDADARTADWLLAESLRLGADARLEAFPFRRRTPLAASLTLPDGRVLEGVPLFDGGETGPDGLRARLGADGDADGGALPVLRVPPYDSLPGARALDDARRAAVHPGIVTVTDDRTVLPGLALLNAESWHAPFGPPVLQLPSEHLDTLRGLAGAEVRLDVRFEEARVTASNVRAEITGRAPDLAPVVVITPRSSWWHSTSERGGGIALWLDLLHMLGTTRPLRTVIFSANTGHELGHVGMQRFLDENEALVSGAHCWVHLGANFAAALHPQVRLQASDADTMALADAALARHRTPPMVRTELGAPPFGEARDIHAGRGRYLSILGANGAFHHPADRWPDSVDLQRTVDIARAFREVLGALAFR